MLLHAEDPEGRGPTGCDAPQYPDWPLLDALRTIVPSPVGTEQWTSRRDACVVLGTTDQGLQALVEAGMVERDGRVERFDVWNVGLRDRSWGARPAREMVFLNRLLRAGGGDWLAARTYDLTVTAQCPWGAGCADAEWARPALVGVHWVSESAAGSSATWRGRVVLEGAAGRVRSAAAAECWDRLMVDYRFQFTAPAVAADVALTRRRGVGDCVGLSLLLVEDLRRSGVEAWVCSGYMFGGLRMRQHQWVAVREADGGLTTLDPSMALLADDFFGPEFREFCCGSRSNRCLQLESAGDWYVEHRCGGRRTLVEADPMLRAS